VTHVDQKQKEIMIKIRCKTEKTKRRFKAFCANLGMTYEQTINYLMDVYEGKKPRAVSFG